MVALIATLSIMMIGMYVAAPSWVYLIRYDREQELIFQGFQMVKAIRAYQLRQGTLPNSFDQLVQSKVLRKSSFDCGDPMMPPTKDGKPARWRRISGDQIPPMCLPAAQQPPVPPQSGPNTPGDPNAPAALGLPPETEGAFIGVMTRYEGESYGIYNNRNRYEQWCFAATDLIPPTVTDLEEFRLLLMTPTEGQRLPVFRGGTEKRDPHSGREPPELGKGGAPPGFFEEPAAPGF
jgi:type II secretory pathway pseudopilin PulG